MQFVSSNHNVAYYAYVYVYTVINIIMACIDALYDDDADDDARHRLKKCKEAKLGYTIQQRATESKCSLLCSRLGKFNWMRTNHAFGKQPDNNSKNAP
jgi:hypothetical protein